MNKYQIAFFDIKLNDENEKLFEYMGKGYRKRRNPIVYEDDTVELMRLSYCNQYVFECYPIPCEVLIGGQWQKLGLYDELEISSDAPIEAIKLYGFGAVDDLILTVNYKDIE